jgi:hypothetical protein
MEAVHARIRARYSHPCFVRKGLRAARSYPWWSRETICSHRIHDDAVCQQLCNRRCLASVAEPYGTLRARALTKAAGCSLNVASARCNRLGTVWPGHRPAEAHISGWNCGPCGQWASPNRGPLPASCHTRLRVLTSRSPHSTFRERLLTAWRGLARIAISRQRLRALLFPRLRVSPSRER